MGVGIDLAHGCGGLGLYLQYPSKMGTLTLCYHGNDSSICDECIWTTVPAVIRSETSKLGLSQTSNIRCCLHKDTCMPDCWPCSRQTDDLQVKLFNFFPLSQVPQTKNKLYLKSRNNVFIAALITGRERLLPMLLLHKNALPKEVLAYMCDVDL